MKDAKKEAWDFYSTWRGAVTYSPALRCEVIISLLGWNHLLGNMGQRKRHGKDVYRRLKLLPFAKEIIEKSTTIQDIIVKNDITYFALEAIPYEKYMTKLEHGDHQRYRKIRVIIVEDRKGNKAFLSVMDIKK